MQNLDRREFLMLAGVAPLGLALPGSMHARPAVPGKPDEFFDPWLEVDVKNLAWNVAQVRKRVENRPIMAVVKCNGYGHGVVEAATAFAQQGIRDFAVVKVPEALAMRESGIKGTILNFGPFTKAEAEQVVRHDLSQSIFSETVDPLAAAARKLGKQAKVHIKVDTGLNRVGVRYDQALPFIEKVAAMPDIAIEGIFTTFTEDIEFDKVQLLRFKDVCAAAAKKGISLGMRHAASSAAVANFPDAFLDMVRPGNCLYGLESLPNLDHKSALSLKTRVIYIKKVHPGETVSYHRRLKVEKETLLATIPLGYSDGYPYRAVNKGDVLIGGKRWPLVAYMSANHVTVDITASQGIKIGDEVVLFGGQGREQITFSEIAEKGDSSVYKVVIEMNPLLPRITV